MKKTILKDFMPVILVSIIVLICIPIYIFTTDKIDVMRLVQCAGAIAIPLVIPLFNLIFKLRIKPFINYIIGLFGISTVMFGAVLDLYTIFPYYDKVVHTLFGLVGGLIIIAFLNYNKIEFNNKFVKFLIVLLAVLGLAACWEIYEYSFSMIFGRDLQGWMPNLDQVGNMTVEEYFKTYNPLWDTMWDIIVALFGVLILYGLLFIDSITGNKFMNMFNKQTEKREIE